MSRRALRCPMCKLVVPEGAGRTVGSLCPACRGQSLRYLGPSLVPAEPGVVGRGAPEAPGDGRPALAESRDGRHKTPYRTLAGDALRSWVHYQRTGSPPLRLAAHLVDAVERSLIPSPAPGGGATDPGIHRPGEPRRPGCSLAPCDTCGPPAPYRPMVPRLLAAAQLLRAGGRTWAGGPDPSAVAQLLEDLAAGLVLRADQTGEPDLDGLAQLPQEDPHE